MFRKQNNVVSLNLNKKKSFVSRAITKNAGNVKNESVLEGLNVSANIHFVKSIGCRKSIFVILIFNRIIRGS